MSAAGGGRAFPWQQAMRLGFGVLRLSPRDFWAMTPRELLFALNLTGGSAVPSREALAAMMRRFPDKEGTNG